jgi:hypothetical protein
MTVSNFTDKLIKYFSWLYFRHWERWELLLIVLICLILLVLIIWQQRKGTTKSVYVNQVRERSPIIGVKLADNKSRLKIEDLKQDSPDSFHKRHSKQRKTKEQLEKLNEQIQQLQLEIGKHKQIEVRLERQVTELRAANEKLQNKAVVNNQTRQSDKLQPAETPPSDDKHKQKITEYKQAEQQPKQIIEVSAVKEKPQHESAESSTVKQQIGELTASKKQSKRRASARKQSGRIIREKTEKDRVPKELREQPLDVQKLKAMAELARQIQGRPRQ